MEAAVQSSKGTKTKKPFDKKKWRENKYSHKAKLDKWTENKNKAMQRKYFKMLKKENCGNGANATPLGNGKSMGSKASYKKTKEEFEKRQKQAENNNHIIKNYVNLYLMLKKNYMYSSYLKLIFY